MFEELPSGRRYAVGGQLGSTTIVCGGYDGDRQEYDDSCISLRHYQCGPESIDTWKKTHTMNTSLSFAASVALNETTLWILGGNSLNGCQR